MKKSDINKIFPDREGDIYADEKKYSWNEITNTVRLSLLNILNEIEYEFEPEEIKK